MAVDLHSHSTASDGTETPAMVVEMAARAGLQAVALTDHDTLEGIEAAQQQADQSGIELVWGVELSCEWSPGTFHMVVLFLETGPLKNRLPELQAGRNDRNRQVLERLSDLGIQIDYREVLAEAGEGSVGRPHIAAVMQHRGYVPDIATAFEQFLAQGRPAYVSRPRLAPPEVIRLAKDSGAVSIVAHPHTLGLNTAQEYAQTYEWLAGLGLTGVECFYGGYRPDRQRNLASSVAKFGLLPSGGSDFHGRYRPGIFIGTGQGDLHVPDTVLSDLRAARPALPSRP